MDYINAFWIGGVICALVQILLDRTKLMPGRVMQPFVEGCERGCRQGRVHWNIHGRIQSKRGRDIRSTCVQLSGISCV